MKYGGFKHVRNCVKQRETTTVSLINQVVYYWQGRHASTDDSGSSALLAQEISTGYGRSATLVRVTQGKEPDHFLSHFQGYCVVRNGHRETWAAENNTKNNLYHIRGTTAMDATASQVETVRRQSTTYFSNFLSKKVSRSLNSNDAFVLVSEDVIFVWEGTGSNEHERATAASMVDKVQDAGRSKHIETVTEKEEPESFWKVRSVCSLISRSLTALRLLEEKAPTMMPNSLSQRET